MNYDLTTLIRHPELLDRDTLYELRSLTALYPYYQTARLLMLQNLYLLHDPTFDEELRRAAIYVTDRRALFDLVEARHYQLRNDQSKKEPQPETPADNSRTVSLIDSFLETIPTEEPKKTKKRKPTAADASVDYVAYLLANESDDEPQQEVPEMRGQSLIDKFINIDNAKFHLEDTPPAEPDAPAEPETEAEGVGEEYFTETLARIYIKQGRYLKALEIIRRLSLEYPKKNAYFADQIRFLEKLIINSNKK